MKAKSSFSYCLSQCFKGLGRHKVFFVASVATISACLFIIGLFTAVVLNLVSIVSEAQDSICISVFFDEGTTDEEISQLGDEILSWSEVEKIEFTSAEEAWENFKENYFKDYPELAEGFADDNPLANSASYDIYLNDISTQGEVVGRLENTDKIRQVNYSETMAGAMTDIGIVVSIISAALVIVLLAVSIFLITNTIIMGITLRREEIQIMKYVGATDAFVKLPFILEGLFIGFVGALIPLIILFLIYKASIHFIIAKFSVLGSAFTFLSAGSVFIWLIPLCGIIGLGIGYIGSAIATNKHIRV